MEKNVKKRVLGSPVILKESKKKISGKDGRVKGFSMKDELLGCTHNFAKSKFEHLKLRNGGLTF
jgi:hypothetical protein